MADKKISELPAAAALVGTETFPIVQAGATVKATLSAMAALGGGFVPDATSAVKGKVRLTNHLGGTADAPTVPGLATKANDADVVHDTGNETVAGIKTFSSAPVVPDSSWSIAKTTGLQTALDARALDADVVHDTGNEDIAGIKTFSGEVRFASGAPTVDVLGAVRDGIADATEAINAAFAQAITNPQGGTGGIYGGESPASGTRYTINLGKGVFKVSGPLGMELGVPQAFMRIVGDGAIIVPTDNTFDVFTAGFMFSMKGVSVRGGKCGLAISSANADTNIIDIEGCEFNGQSQACIRSENSASTIVVCRGGSKLVNRVGKILMLNTCDKFVLRDGWVTAGAGINFDLTDAGLELESLIMVPASSSGPWVDAKGLSSFSAKRTRFGGEGGGKVLVDWRAAPSLAYPVNPLELLIENCSIFTPSGEPLVRFYALPNITRITGNRGNTDSAVLYFDAAIPAAERKQIGQYVTLDIDPNMQPIRLASINGSTDTQNRVQAFRDTNPHPASYLIATDRVFAAPVNSGGSGAALSQSGVGTFSYETNAIGKLVLRGVATAANGTFTKDFNTALSGLAAGVYTFVSSVDVGVGSPVQVILTAGGVRKDYEKPQGAFILNVPFYFDPDAGLAQSTTLGVTIGAMRVGQQVDVGDYRLFKGEVFVSTPHSEVYGTVAPTAGDWFAGDRVIVPAPAAGGNVGLVCVTAGTPGTWKTFGAVEA